MVPTTRLTLRIGKVARTFSPRSMAGCAKLQQDRVVKRLFQPMVLRDLAETADSVGTSG